MRYKDVITFALLIMISSGAVYAQSVTVYTTVSANSLGYDRVSTTANPPSSPFDTTWQALNAAAMTNMSTDNAVRYETRRTTARYQFDSQLFSFKVAESADVVTQLDVKWNGYGEAQAAYPCYLYIWERNTPSWQLIQQSDIGAPDGTLSGVLSSGFSNYISPDGYVYLTAQAKHYNYAPTITLSSPGSGTWQWDNSTASLSWTRSDSDNDSLESYAEIRRSDSGWTTNSGWIAGSSWSVGMPWNGWWYYWRAQVRDGIVTSSFTSEWSVGWEWSKSSCPFFYVWDGEKYQYITDIGGSGIGIKDKNRDKDVSLIRPAQVVMGKNFPAKNGNYEVKIKEILREITYLDEAQLWVVDCPSDYEIASSSAEQAALNKLNDIYMPPECEFYTINTGKAILPVSAIDNNGTDILAVISAVDGRPAPVDENAEMNYYILDFGRINADYVKLVFDGWRADVDEYPKESGPVRSIELMNDKGEWEKVRSLGKISGDFKTIAVPLKGLFKNRKDHRIKVINYGKRRHINMYDRIRLDASPDIALDIVRIPVSEAVLSFAGMPTLDGIGNKEKRILLRDDSNPVDSVKLFKGNFTRYGEVTELLKNTDDRYVIMNSGDQVLLKFSELKKPLVKGADRTFILKTFLHFKAGSDNPAQTVLPMPFKGMKKYPYTAADAGYPFTPENKLSMQKYNTREYKTDPLLHAYFDKNSTLKYEYMKAAEEPHSLNTDFVELKVTYDSSGTAPSIPTLSYPVDAATDVETSLTFVWGASSGSSPITYQMQLASDAGFTSIISDISNIATVFYLLSLSLDTQYFWRIKAMNSLGASGWSSTWSFTTGGIPSVPVQAGPANTADGVELSPVFEWNASSGASPVSYTLQVDTESAFLNPITIDLGGLYVTAYNTTAVLNENTLYYWRVQASNDFGDSAWSATWTFTTGIKPGVPALSLPVSGVTGVDMPVVLEWNTVSGSSGITYTVQVDADITFASPDYNQGYITNTKFIVNSLNNAEIYYWRVKAVNAIGESSWSSIWPFTTSASATVPTVPDMSSPSDTAANIALNTVLLWEASSGTAPISYTVQVDGDLTFTSPLENTGNAAWYQPSGLVYGATYYWRVKASNGVGNSSWSATRSFTTMSDPALDPSSPPVTGELPSKPVLDIPANGAEDIDIGTVLGWLSSSGTSPVKYDLQIGLDQPVSQVLFTASDISASFKAVTNLPYEMNLYWRVKAKNAYGESEWTDAWSFKTKTEETAGTGGGSTAYALIVTTPSAMIFYAQYGSTTPAAKKLAVFNGGTANFTWTLHEDTDWMTVNPLTGSSVQITDVDVIVDASGRPEGVYSGMITITAENASNSPVTVPVTLYIYNDASPGSSGGSPGTTDANAPSKPVLFSPANGAIGLYPAPKLVWENTAGTSYWLQVSNEQGFGTLLASKTLDAAEYQTTGMQIDTTYYWRVKAVNSAGMSEWSDTWWFRVQSKTGAGNDETPSVVKGCFIKTLK
ncbi:MAG: hypothetical protein HZA48_05135 [Planctomycetes bacterium]|nr:hypothetical protein [Planctomycetota bacterium]